MTEATNLHFSVGAFLRYRYSYVHAKVLLTPDSFTDKGRPAYLVVGAHSNKPYARSQKEIENGDWVQMPETYSNTIRHWFQDIPLLTIQKFQEDSAKQEIRFLFPLNSHVRHKKTGGVYEIKATPEKAHLEATGKPAYFYEGEDGKVWARDQTLMEDGRFEAILTPVAAIGQ
jgi:hypothetical protein